jgi:hypothetical protein
MKEVSVDLYLELIKEHSIKNNLIYEELGYVYEDPIIFIKTKDEPNKLICSGIHGDEESGPYSILGLIMNNEIPERTAFLPMISPSSNRLHKRRNIEKLNVNRGWGQSSKVLSKEGKIITNNINKILPCSLKGVLSLHETIDKKYILFVNSKNSITWINKMIGTAKQRFDIIEDMSEKDYLAEYTPTKNGIILNAHDSSFETFIHELGCDPVMTNEVPQKASMEDKNYINKNLIDVFCSNVNKEVGELKI